MRWRRSPLSFFNPPNQQQKAAAAAWERWVAQQRLSLGELLEQVPSCKPSLEGE